MNSEYKLGSLILHLHHISNLCKYVCQYFIKYLSYKHTLESIMFEVSQSECRNCYCYGAIINCFHSEIKDSVINYFWDKLGELK